MYVDFLRNEVSFRLGVTTVISAVSSRRRISVQDQPPLKRKFAASLSYIRP